MTTGRWHKPTLAGELVTLRPIVIGDATAMWELVQDPEGNDLTDTTASFTFEQIRDWCSNRAEQDERLDLAIVENATGEFAGEAVLNEYRAEPRPRTSGSPCAVRPGMGGGLVPKRPASSSATAFTPSGSTASRSRCWRATRAPHGPMRRQASVGRARSSSKTDRPGCRWRSRPNDTLGAIRRVTNTTGSQPNRAQMNEMPYERATAVLASTFGAHVRSGATSVVSLRPSTFVAPNAESGRAACSRQQTLRSVAGRRGCHRADDAGRGRPGLSLAPMSSRQR